MKLAPKSLALASWLTAVAAAADAQAFCRSTTCAGDCPVDDDGCKTTGTPLSWPGMCVSISVHEDASRHIPLETARPAIVAAFTEWSRRSCADGPSTIAFLEMPDASCHEVEYVEGGPNANVVMFQDDKWIHGGAQNTLGRTTVTFDVDTGEIVDADMEINHALNELTVSDEQVVYDLQSIVTHEVGHLVGLDHSSETDTIMHATYTPSSTADRMLRADDVTAVCSAYPPDRQAQCAAEPEGGFTPACASETVSMGCAVPSRPKGAGAPLALALLLVPLARRRRRQRQVFTSHPSMA